MARRTGRSSRRRRDEEEVPEVIPVAEPVEHGSRRRGTDRPLREPKGLAFAMPVSFGAGLVAAILAFVAALGVGQMAAGDPGAAVNAGGVAAARLLSARDMDSWRKGFGGSAGLFKRLDAELGARRKEIEDAGDSIDASMFDTAVDEWKNGTFESRSAYVPGFYKIFGRPDEASLEDAKIELARLRGLKKATENAGATLLGAQIYEAGGQTLVAGVGNVYSPSSKPIGQVGETKIYAASVKGGGRVRIYDHPIQNRAGNLAGFARVTVDASMAKGPDVAAIAAAGAGAAFLGAFLIALILCGKPVKALKKLAVESDALARGEFGTHMSTHGPGLISMVAKSVQRLGVLASEGGGEPQVVHQAVEAVPLEDIAGGLAASRSFERPDALEVEATFKQCAEAGNDYHDSIQVDDDHYGFVVADIPLHGVAGALLMAQVKALFRAHAPGQPHPAEALKAMNRAFARDLPRGLYVTVCYAVVNAKTGVCRVANAQHLPMVFWKRAKKASARVACPGIALGLDKGPVFDKAIEEKAIQMDPGDRIVLYTDGAINAKNAAGVTYGEEKFYYVMNREAPKNSAAFVNFVANDMDLFHEGAPQGDDFTILTARRLK